MDALAFLERGERAKLQPVYVLHGDEDFLKRQVLAVLRGRVFGAEASEFGLSTYPGDKADWAEIHDELATLPFLGPRRLIVVEGADAFVTQWRAALEKYVALPAASGILVLDVKSWPANTRLAKQVDNAGTIVCKAPAAYRLPDWCTRWAASRHGKDLPDSAARLLVDLIGADMGVLDQELAKLAIYVGDATRVEEADVDRLVGRSREEKTFKIFDAIGGGRPNDALAILARLFEQGEDPLAILGAFSWQLRRLVQVDRLRRQGLSSARAMDEAGVPPFARQGCVQQLQHLGARVDLLFDWLLEADLGLKGGSQLPPRTLLERLVMRLSV